MVLGLVGMFGNQVLYILTVEISDSHIVSQYNYTLLS